MTDSEFANRPTVLIFTLSQFDREPRALKQLAILHDDYEVTTAGFGPAPDSTVTHIELDAAPRQGIMRIPGIYTVLVMLRLHRLRGRLLARNRAAFKALSRSSWDLIVTHDVSTVPVSRRLRSRRGVLVDLHEFAPRQGEESQRWRRVEGRYFDWIVRKLVTRATSVSTVSQGIVDAYRREYGIAAELVINASPYHSGKPRPTRSPIRLVHSGAPSAARRIEAMIDAVRVTTADVTLDLYLIDDGSDYVATLRDRAADLDRVTFHEPVPYDDLIDTLAGYDLGISLLAPTNFNHVWALPNKLFDYIQARIGVIIGPSPEMQRIVDQYGVGGVSDDFSAEALARFFESVDPARIDEWKRNADRHAHELSSESQSQVWLRMLRSIFAKEASGGKVS